VSALRKTTPNTHGSVTWPIFVLCKTLQYLIFLLSLVNPIHTVCEQWHLTQRCNGPKKIFTVGIHSWHPCTTHTATVQLAWQRAYIFRFARLVSAAYDDSFHVVDGLVKVLKVLQSKFLVDDLHVTDWVHVTLHVRHLVVLKYPCQSPACTWRQLTTQSTDKKLPTAKNWNC